MKNITCIKEGINIIFREEIGNGEDLYQYGELLYEGSTKYPLGFIVIDSPHNQTPLGWFAWDDNYIYKCLEGYDKDAVELVFNLNNRTFIESKEKREELYDTFLEKKNQPKRTR